MPRNGEEVRLRLQEAALELYLERGYDKTTAGDIAARAGVTERTFFRHFADKREVFFDGEAELRDLLTGAVAAVPAGTKPLPTLRAAFHQAVPLIERNLPVTERRAPVIAATPALQERALAKTAALVAALTDALVARGVAGPLAALCAQVGMDTYAIAVRRWGADRTDDLHTHLDRAFTDLRLAANALK
ncbi:MULTISPECIES: TetR/AcrR family transcriptional regulator [Amycolatopsis]|uniref:DNA-binding transcriptional regulator, AcrR family n=1 Tax=Amycolatopsis sacchari TaxID=115433 RepID=A0A1I3RZD6_9PSEU|nr:TetR/AcrR family transcriptional regulator [Amycolatopsis sacchari]SFJ51292.1 DNA-binding transcriptional regulator, AcrR family [Amycolatopsis sacchari]